MVCLIKQRIIFSRETVINGRKQEIAVLWQSCFIFVEITVATPDSREKPDPEKVVATYKAGDGTMKDLK